MSKITREQLREAALIDDIYELVNAREIEREAEIREEYRELVKVAIDWRKRVDEHDPDVWPETLHLLEAIQPHLPRKPKSGSIAAYDGTLYVGGERVSYVDSFVEKTPEVEAALQRAGVEI